MDAIEAMRSVGSCRSYRPDDVPDEVLYRAVESARFAPQGGNRQPTRLVAGLFILKHMHYLSDAGLCAG